MADDTVILVENVSKAYRIWESPAARLLAPLQAGLAGVFPSQSGPARRLRDAAARRYRDFYALREVSFVIRRGESVGIIGRNGSGKSTLLQIIAGTLQPTTGRSRACGRVAALLELGSGFNPEFTGRENVYLNAAVLGLGRADTDGRFAAIADFANIGDFMDQPVKTYSSGMMVRLAFAVQIQLEPEILIVDEALAVGDEPFQRKCFNQISLMQQRGVTILFVSHSSATVVELCQRVLLLDHGRRILTSHPKQAVQYYNQLCYAPAEALPRLHEEISRADAEAGWSAAAPGPSPAAAPATPPVGEMSSPYFVENMIPETRSEFPSLGARIGDLQIVDENLQPVNVLVTGQNYQLQFRVRFERDAARVRFGWTAKSVSGIILAGAATHQPGDGLGGVPAGQEIEVSFAFCNLFNYGTYFINVAVRAFVDKPDVIVHGISDALMFKVQPTPGTHRNGYVDCSVKPVWLLKNAQGKLLS